LNPFNLIIDLAIDACLFTVVILSIHICELLIPSPSSSDNNGFKFLMY